MGHHRDRQESPLPVEDSPQQLDAGRESALADLAPAYLARSGPGRGVSGNHNVMAVAVADVFLWATGLGNRMLFFLDGTSLESCLRSIKHF